MRDRPRGRPWGTNFPPGGEKRKKRSAASVNERGARSCAITLPAAKFAARGRPPRGKSTLPGVKVSASTRARSDATGRRALTRRGSSSPRPRVLAFSRSRVPAFPRSRVPASFHAKVYPPRHWVNAPSERPPSRYWNVAVNIKVKTVL